MCQTIVNNQLEDDLAVLSQWFWFKHEEATTIESCFDFKYGANFWVVNGTEWSEPSSAPEIRQLVYKTCVMFGWHQSAVTETTIFGNQITADLTLKWCEDNFSEK